MKIQYGHDGEGATEPPEVPRWLVGTPARAAFVNGYRSCVLRNDWEPIYFGILGVLAASAGRHVQLQREIALLDPATISQEIQAVAAETRSVARRAMAEMFLLPKAAINGGTIRPDGLDTDIAALCDVPAVQ